MHWIWFIIVGAIVGVLGRLVHPGRDPMGWLLTIAVGIVAMIIAAAISSGWVAFVIGVIIAALLVMLNGRFTGDGRRAGARIGLTRRRGGRARAGTSCAR
jgi:uncharacterized membrane protein YeaQ/YmgE (transglycosylase-associated protein family)